MCWFKNRPYYSWYIKYKVLNISVIFEFWVIFELQNVIFYILRNLVIVWMASKCHNHRYFKISMCLSSTVCAQLYHAGTDAQLDANGKRQPVFPAAYGQLRHAVVCKTNIHSNTLHEWGNSHQVSMDYQRNAEDQDTVCHLRQCQYQRHWQGRNAVHQCGAVTTSSCFL